MGNYNSVQYMNFEDIQKMILENIFYGFSKEYRLLINTLQNNNQNCLIENTINSLNEEEIINNIIKEKNQNKYLICIYGENCNDANIMKKYNQLLQLGFNRENIYIYNGGLFEWLCLQDIYGDDEFLTTNKELDILKYKPYSDIQKKYIKLLTY